jgi:hypothetical protein
LQSRDLGDVFFTEGGGAGHTGLLSKSGQVGAYTVTYVTVNPLYYALPVSPQSVDLREVVTKRHLPEVGPLSTPHRA